MKAVPLNGARETATLAGAHHIHPIAHSKDLDRDPLTLFKIAEIANTKLTQVSQRRRVGALQMPELSARQTPL